MARRAKPGPAQTVDDIAAAMDVPAATAPTIELWPLDRLKAYHRNSRTHDAEQVAKIARSIEAFGFTNPILAAEDGTIIAGHGRLLAAARLKLESVPVIVARGWSEEQRRAYVITDNKLALDAGWDDEMLKLELGDLADVLFDLELTGFTGDEMDKLFGRIADEKPPADTGQQLDGLTFSIVVRCTGEAHQAELLERFEAEGLKAEALIS